jgi:hypothetical protein
MDDQTPTVDKERSERIDKERSERISWLRRRLWVVSALVSLACVIVLVGAWVRVYTAPPAPEPGDTVMSTPDGVKRYLAGYIPPGETFRGEAPMFIPTGVYIASMEFKGSYDVQMSGYIWQRYANDLPQGIEPQGIKKGFVMPEANYLRFEEVDRARQGNEELITWSFNATLREQFDYRSYPLDRQQIRLLLWYPNFNRNVYLVPDLAAYTSPGDPATLPGLHKNFVLENWDIQQSFFSYRANTYNANFGIKGYEADQKLPELYYNVSIKRYLLSSLISRTITPLVILIQLFVLVAVIGPNSERLEKFGVRPGGVIFTCAAFFFAVLLAQNSLRGEVQAGGLVYLESLYILTYFVILAVAINSVLLVAQPNLKLFRDYDNLWAEVLYWPAILLTLVVITLVALF